ncbi:MAG TPA: AMMECR1 domain-containing protein [Polyangiaceae bacterium]|nr:AMMECR1 domain-containing protein [Polyangiaceae bacterium]
MIGCLEATLDQSERDAVREELEGLLAFQRDLAVWRPLRPGSPVLRGLTPIVSLYVHGELRGCQAHGGGAPEQRLARAFLAASADQRFRALTPDEREQIVAQVSYARRLRQISVKHVKAEFVAGVHGLMLVAAEGPVLLVPDVARDLALDEEGFVGVLEQKANSPRDAWGKLELFAFETERVVARTDGYWARQPALPAVLNWLAQQVELDGRVRFGLDSRSGESLHRGFLRHARTASVVQALSVDSTTAPTAARARTWLTNELERGHSGQTVDDWPDDAAGIAATWALASLAGIRCEAVLGELARAPALHAEPWHAAQVVAALGQDAPTALWQVCVDSLAREPFAPWTAIAAHRRSDEATFERAIRMLVERLPPREFGFVAEPALAGLTLEALALSSNSEVGSRRAEALELLRQSQLWADSDPAPLASWVHGAFPLAANQSLLRCDASAHAALALR